LLRKRIVEFSKWNWTIFMDTLHEVQLRSKLHLLYQEHRDLDDAIAAFEASGKADPLQLQRLKKMKLGIKDKILQIENMLIPDIIA
jgi:hypothetical protein